MQKNKQEQSRDKFPVKTAILVDGGFYRKRAYYFHGEKTPVERAQELSEYCKKLLHDSYEQKYLYRIFYYDCPPIAKQVYHPLLKKTIDLGKTPDYVWATEFYQELRHQRKFALRLGKISESSAKYALRPEITNKLFSGAITLSDITEKDFCFQASQKGVDMKIGIDISSLAFKKQVDQIILISGDSDFVPAAKQARREGIDFILDPMRSTVKDDLFEHIDGIKTVTPSSPKRNRTH